MTSPQSQIPSSSAVAHETSTSSSEADGTASPPSRLPVVTLVAPSIKDKRASTGPTKAFRVFRSVIRSFPILTPACRLSATLPRISRHTDGHIRGATRTTGTLFGHRKGRITLAIQETPKGIPLLLLEIGIPTARFIGEMSSGLLRLALECEKRASGGKTKLLDDPVWTAFVNGRKIGCAARREPTETDLYIMQLLHAVSMGAGVLPGDMTHPTDGELTYMRAYFDRVIGSRDSETFYMLNPDEKTGPELSIFFVRV